MTEKKKLLSLPTPPKKPVKPQEFLSQKLVASLYICGSHSIGEFNASIREGIESIRHAYPKADFGDEEVQIDIGIDYGYYDSAAVEGNLKVQARIPNPHYEQQLKKYELDEGLYPQVLAKYQKQKAAWDDQEIDRKRAELEKLEVKAAKLRKKIEKTEV